MSAEYSHVGIYANGGTWLVSRELNFAQLNFAQLNFAADSRARARED